MSLDLSKITSQVAIMTAKLEAIASERASRVDFAMQTLSNYSTKFSDWQAKIEDSYGKTTWLVAGLKERPDAHYPAPPIPTDYIAFATDGSSIDIDRHRPVSCFLINIGQVILQYGKQPSAVLESTPHLYCDTSEIIIRNSANRREQRIEGTLVGIKTLTEECRYLVSLSSSLPNDKPSLALYDGTLVLWGLEAYPDFVTNALLINGFVKYLDEARKWPNRQAALASYISMSRATEVVNALRIAICPSPTADCDQL